MPKSTTRGDRHTENSKNRHRGANCHDALHRRDIGFREELADRTRARNARHATVIDDGDWAAPLPASIFVFVPPQAAEKPAAKAAPARKRTRTRRVGSRRPAPQSCSAEVVFVHASRAPHRGIETGTLRQMIRAGIRGFLEAFGGTPALA